MDDTKYKWIWHGLHSRETWNWRFILGGPAQIIDGIFDTVTFGWWKPGLYNNIIFWVMLSGWPEVQRVEPTEEEKEAERKRQLRFFSNQIVDQFLMEQDDD